MMANGADAAIVERMQRIEFTAAYFDVPMSRVHEVFEQMTRDLTHMSVVQVMDELTPHIQLLSPSCN